MAKLYFRFGAMNCGKTTHLLQTAYNYEERGMRILLAKPKIDTKGDRKVLSRIGSSREVDFLVGEDDSFLKILESYNGADYHAILIDEAQFLTPKQVDELMVVALSGVPVLTYGLRSDYLTNSFPGSDRLLTIAHSLEEMKTICACGKKAIFNRRIVDGEPVTDSSDNQQVAIDGDNVTYVSMCGECYNFSA